MTGASRNACPDCGAATESISDCFTGPASAVDNFDEVEEHLRDEDLVSDDEYDLYSDEVSRDEYETALNNANVEPRDGPFITDTIVCTETWCTTCTYSERTYTPPHAVVDTLADALTAN